MNSTTIQTTEHNYILGMKVNTTDYARAIRTIANWAGSRQSRVVCAANVHMTMESHNNPDFCAVINGADLVVPDGMPLVWALRLLGSRHQTRVRGPDLMLKTLKEAERAAIPVGFYGSRPETVSTMLAKLRDKFPNLVVAYSESPPFRPLTAAEQASTIEAINRSGARIIFVGLGCPKQEWWMATHKDKLNTVMLGVGAAFDFAAGTTPEAPRWLMNIGCEWVFRLLTEPKRLWKRYLKHNPRFVILFLHQLLQHGT